MIIPFRSPASHGIILDIPAHDLPPEAWSYGNNVRFRNGQIEKFNGHERVYSGNAPVAGAHFLLPYFQLDGEFAWIIVGATAPKVIAALVTISSSIVNIIATFTTEMA